MVPMLLTDFLIYLISYVLELIYFEKSICTYLICFKGNEEGSSVLEYCITMMGYNVQSSSLDYVTYITKFVQACLCYKQTLDDNVEHHVVTMSAWQYA